VPAPILRRGAPEEHLWGAQDRPSREESGAALRRRHRRPSLGVPVGQRPVREIQDLVAVRGDLGEEGRHVCSLLIFGFRDERNRVVDRIGYTLAATGGGVALGRFKGYLQPLAEISQSPGVPLLVLRNRIGAQSIYTVHVSEGATAGLSPESEGYDRTILPKRASTRLA